jgi:hypothetical protein
MDPSGAYEGSLEGSGGEGVGRGRGGGGGRNTLEIGVSGKVKEQRGSTTTLGETSEEGCG